MLAEYRDLFVGINETIELPDGKKVIPINFDNGATTPAFKLVQDCVNNSLVNYGSIGRGKGKKALYCTKFYEKSRRIILKFFNLSRKSPYDVIYVKNTTEGLNLLASILVDNDDIVLTTRMEHHANDLPWRFVGKIEYIDVDNKGKINIEDIEDKFKNSGKKIKYLTITAASNVTGYINPINKIAKIVHKYGAKIIVDAAQLVAHKNINIKGSGDDDYIDFLVFSAHKMYAPFGIGAIVASKKALNNKKAFLKGGGAVDLVLDNEVYWAESPSKYEAGSPNFLGVVALIASIKMLNKIGFSNINEHEKILKNYLLEGLKNFSGITCYGDCDEEQRLAVGCFNVNNIHCEKVSEYLSDIRGIAVRDGCFCAHTYVRRLLGITEEICKKTLNPNVEEFGMIRVSMGLYNTIEEIDEFFNALEYITMKFGKK
ncbi:aminotransferase class V-fold PLP-dependent enzyme [Clostridium tarantellae]|uniref:Aminotransferase class V-fold PLP-dependent enzyme n=1 Tax=Clostridium tarantellae TaxID=39493 RepID=A0A6I1MLD2_9CLOT|nr:aminotransferase class V-fold PLP-dependent enzyme [Clostridium tarantellae]